MTGETPILETRGLTRHFGGLVAVDQVDFSMRQGEIRCLIGPNGAGKTTFFNLITSTIPPSAGEILFRGESLADLQPHQIVRIGLVRTFQIPNLFDHLSVLDNVAIAVQRTRGAVGAWRPTAAYPEIYGDASAALARVGLPPEDSRVAVTLAHAEKKRLELAIALACDPEVLLLDEPTAGMTVAETRETAHLIKQIAVTHTILVVEHDIDFIREIAEFITVFHRGRILLEGPLALIEKDPTVREIYLGEDAA